MRNKTQQPVSIPPAPAWWPEHLLDEHEAAQLLGTTAPTLQGWRCRKTRDLPFVKMGASVRYNPDDVWAWLNRNTVRPAVCA